MLKVGFIVCIICAQIIIKKILLKLQLYSTKSNTITINILRFLFKIFHKTLGWVKNVLNYLTVHNIINLEKKKHEKMKASSNISDTILMWYYKKLLVVIKMYLLDIK